MKISAHGAMNSAAQSSRAQLSSKQSLYQQPTDENAKRAEEFKNRLLAQDKQELESRSRLHDITEDYNSVSTDIWLSPEERALAMRAEQEFMQRKEAERRQMRINIDLESKQIVEDEKRFSEITKRDWQKDISRPQTLESNKMYADERPWERRPIYIPGRRQVTVKHSSNSLPTAKPGILQDE